MIRSRRAAICGALAVVVLAAPLHSSQPAAPVQLAGSRLAASAMVPSPLGWRGGFEGVVASLTTGLRVPAPPEPVGRVAALPRRTTEAVAPRASRTVPSYAVRRGAAALAALPWPWQEVGFEIEFLPYRGRFLGLTDARTRTISIFVRRGQSEGDLRTTIAHEIGHALDAVTGTEEMRRSYREVRGIGADVAWYPCERCDDLRSPAGDFAETFARWLVGPGHVRRTLASAPDAEQLSVLSYFFEPLSTRQG